MPTAKPRASLGLAPGVPGEVYGDRDNIAVPEADNADAQIAVLNAAAIVTNADRPGRKTIAVTAKGSERTTN